METEPAVSCFGGILGEFCGGAGCVFVCVWLGRRLVFLGRWLYAMYVFCLSESFLLCWLGDFLVDCVAVFIMLVEFED